ncbi:hypothetical protein D9V29_02590 [Mycetocola manganoxydans]|uniref:Uncharacterized protein n=1 Tax=Mycetocola manganoxydans TaxID=699879 RepID=A0A3L6ZY09_9MICO|nr:hypothetical protein [Mycetocola manganoxydans]RLP72913.1 hypothetical protein D9V29_02590 [Mycetocola manganoxydans]GHD45013.1 hypothetical protein GCM10008097_13740 [Mycetocola manganoxydans]
MRISFRTVPRTAIVAAAAVVTMIGIGLPASTTGAHLTIKAAVVHASSGVGTWCSVPNPAVASNVYKLSEFTEIQAPESTTDPRAGKTTVRMLVVPVVNDGSFEPVEPLAPHIGGVENQLGVRLWSCTPGMSATQSIKLTAWRGNYATTAASAFVWDAAPSATVPFARARLNTDALLAINGSTTNSTRPGVELRDAHRGINRLGGQSGANADPLTMRYSWMLTNGRTKNADFANDPFCASKTCRVDGGSGATNYNNVFSGVDTAAAANAVHRNSTTYLAEKYYSASGAWPTTTTTVQQLQCRSKLLWEDWRDNWYNSSTACPRSSTWTQYQSREIDVTVTADASPTATPTVVLPKGSSSVDSLLRDTTGTKVQYVVLEWWGAGTPPEDLEVEVFVK